MTSSTVFGTRASLARAIKTGLLYVHVPLAINQERVSLERELMGRQSVVVPPGHIQVALQLKGELDVQCLADAVNEVARRHAGLRLMIFPNLGLPHEMREARVQLFARSGIFDPGLFLQSVVGCPPVTFRIVDVSNQEAGLLDRAIRESVEVDGSSHFTAPPMIRALLLKLAASEHLLVLTFNHLFSDGWSTRIIRREIELLYAQSVTGTPAPLEFPPISFPDFAQWQYQMFSSTYFNDAVRFWREQWVQFGSARIGFEDLPFSRPAPARPAFEFGTEVLQIGPVESMAIRSLTGPCGVTLYMIFLAGFYLTIHRYTGRSPIAVWGHFFNRLQPELQNTVGFCANTHLLGLSLSPDLSGRDLLHRVRNIVLAASAHQHLPLPHLWRVLRCHPRLPDANLLLTYRQTRRPSNAGGLQIEEARLPSVAAPRWSSLGVYVTDDGQQFSLRSQYAKDRFPPDAIQHLLQDLHTVLLKLASRPDTTISSYAEASRYSPRPYRQNGSMGEFLILGSHLIPKIRSRAVSTRESSASAAKVASL